MTALMNLEGWDIRVTTWFVRMELSCGAVDKSVGSVTAKIRAIRPIRVIRETGILVGCSSAFYVLTLARIWKDKSEPFIKKGYHIMVLLFSLFILAGSSSSRSSTSVGVFMLGVMITFGLNGVKHNIKTIRSFLVVTFLIILFANLMTNLVVRKSLFEVVVGAFGRDVTLTGRTPLWDVLLKLGARKPLHGAGYSGFWISSDSMPLRYMFDWIPDTAHNGYIDLYVNIGLIGLVFLIGMIVIGYLKMEQAVDEDFNLGRFRIVFLVMNLIYNITESNWIYPTNLLWFIFVLINIDVRGIYPSSQIDTKVDEKEVGAVPNRKGQLRLTKLSGGCPQSLLTTSVAMKRNERREAKREFARRCRKRRLTK